VQGGRAALGERSEKSGVRCEREKAKTFLATDPIGSNLIIKDKKTGMKGMNKKAPGRQGPGALILTRPVSLKQQ
jgi:hypothetical protein